MREAVRGFAAAFGERARARNDLPRLAAEMRAVATTVESSPELAALLEDGGVPMATRRDVLSEVFSGRVGDDCVAVARFAVEAERPPEAFAALDLLAERYEEAATLGPDEDIDLPAPRLELSERLEGYALAVLGEVAQRSELEEVEDEIFRFARIIEANEELAAALGDQDRPAPERASLASELLEGRAGSDSRALVRYAVRIARGGELIFLLDNLVEHAARELGRRVAHVRSPMPLEEGQRARLHDVLSQLSGRDVEVRVEHDPSLVGGLVVLIGDTVVDGSLSHRLSELTAALTGSGARRREQRGGGRAPREP